MEKFQKISDFKVITTNEALKVVGGSVPTTTQRDTVVRTGADRPDYEDHVKDYGSD